jgi:hypothetical protein
MIGWIQSNKRWDILLSVWEDIHDEIKRRSGQDWDLLAAGTMRDPMHRQDYAEWKTEIQMLEGKGIAHYHRIYPPGRGLLQIDGNLRFLCSSSTDETQSGTLARIIALNKPLYHHRTYGRVDSPNPGKRGGLLFTTKEMLKQKVIKLAT